MLDYDKRHQQLQSWLTQSIDQGWLDDRAQKKFDLLETEDAEKLFSNTTLRPLVVAFFGGTGTGKSSLLNRLANTDIAITGAARPTSHEVTIYLHQQHQLTDSVSSLPMQKTRVHYHEIEQRQHVAWLDMPDFDSVENANRALVEQWLPYIDYLVYVVSPERYHDDLGWQILQQRQQRHQWLFVMNHWDEGKPEQYDDFRAKIDQAGFSEAKLLRTSCIEPNAEDDFNLLEQHLTQAITDHGLEQLQQTGALARINDLQNLSTEYLQTLGSEAQWQTLSQSSASLATQQSKGLISLWRDQALGLLQPLQTMEEETSWFKNKQTAVRLPDTGEVSEYLSNQRSANYLQRIVYEQEHHCSTQDLPGQPLAQELAPIGKDMNSVLENNILAATQKAMARPGTILQRILYKCCSWLSFLLPLSVSLWAGWFLFHHYREGMQGTEEFLGFGFISNTLMLISLAWFIPWLIKRKLQPSLLTSFKRGIFNAIEQTGIELEIALKQAVTTVLKKQKITSEALQALQQD